MEPVAERLKCRLKGQREMEAVQAQMSCPWGCSCLTLKLRLEISCSADHVVQV